MDTGLGEKKCASKRARPAEATRYPKGECVAVREISRHSRRGFVGSTMRSMAWEAGEARCVALPAVIPR